jgi:aspartate 1-decarboxylase
MTKRIYGWRKKVMMRKILNAKLHRVKVTGTACDYEGSITIGEDVLEASGIKPFESVLVANTNNGERFETYVMEGKSGEIIVNGAAARLAAIGDKLIVLSFVWIEEKNYYDHSPVAILFDDNNKIRNILKIKL